MRKIRAAGGKRRRKGSGAPRALRGTAHTLAGSAAHAARAQEIVVLGPGGAEFDTRSHTACVHDGHACEVNAMQCRPASSCASWHACTHGMALATTASAAVKSAARAARMYISRSIIKIHDTRIMRPCQARVAAGKSLRPGQRIRWERVQPATSRAAVAPPTLVAAGAWGSVQGGIGLCAAQAAAASRRRAATNAGPMISANQPARGPRSLPITAR